MIVTDYSIQFQALKIKYSYCNDNAYLGEDYNCFPRFSIYASNYLHPLLVGDVLVLAATVASLIAAIATPYSSFSQRLRPKKYKLSER